MYNSLSLFHVICARIREQFNVQGVCVCEEREGGREGEGKKRELSVVQAIIRISYAMSLMQFDFSTNTSGDSVTWYIESITHSNPNVSSDRDVRFVYQGVQYNVKAPLGYVYSCGKLHVYLLFMYSIILSYIYTLITLLITFQMHTCALVCMFTCV